MGCNNGCGFGGFGGGSCLWNRPDHHPDLLLRRELGWLRQQLRLWQQLRLRQQQQLLLSKHRMRAGVSPPATKKFVFF